MKVPRLLLLCSLLVAFLSSQARAGDFLVDWKFGEALVSEGSIKLTDRTGNGYDVMIPAGAKIESDPGATGGKAMVFNGNMAMALEAEKKLEAMPSVQLSMKVKPSEEFKGAAELAGATSRWSLRYMSSRKSVVLVVYMANGTPGKSYWELECKAQPGAWNSIAAQISDTFLMLRVGENQTKITGQNMLVFGAFDPVKFQILRPMPGTGKDQVSGFIGSVSDFTLGLKK